MQKPSNGKIVLLIGLLAALAIGGKHALAGFVPLDDTIAPLGAVVGIVCGVVCAWLAAGREKTLGMIGAMLALSPVTSLYGKLDAALAATQQADPSIAALSLIAPFTSEFALFTFLLLGLAWFFNWLESRKANSNSDSGDQPKN
jgi:hypothetical protein